MARLYYVYILASGRNGTLYIGVTNNLRRRIEEHRSENPKAFTSRYKVNQLVHVETFNNVRLALQREKRLKKWKRSWKLELIEKDNPTWRDLSEDLH
ncbi:MAG: GIY-YIG nuclease family protein [bacterium]